MKRDWTAARAKVRDDGRCRVCAASYIILDPAHVIPRSRIGKGGEDPRNIVGLCRRCHDAYDRENFDLLPYLTLEEQAYAVGLVGLEEARRYITNERAA
jgi:hypothetical protein